MTIEEIFKEKAVSVLISKLKSGRLKDMPILEDILKEWDPKKHRIMTDKTYRPDKMVSYDEPDGSGGFVENTRLELVARICVAFQKLIVKRATSFLFGNDVNLISSDPDGKLTEIIKLILSAVKQKSKNKQIARILFACTEVAECWYAVPGENEDYGFLSKDKLRMTIFSPLNGDKLYPYFDQYGDMIAFSREYSVKEDDKSVTYFETWTDKQYYKWKLANSNWEEAQSPAMITIGKIPVVYAWQDEVEWKDVQEMIDRFEKVISNFADTNDYHGSPKMVAKGTVKGFSRKGETGGILEVSGDDADVKYLAWEQAPDSIKLEIENLFRLIFSLTQTPDISFEAVKDMGNAASGESIKMLFMDAHLKVMDHMETFDDYLPRRYNILKAFVVAMNPGLKADAGRLRLTPQVIPYMIDDITGKLQNITTAVSAGILSQESAVSQNPLVSDPKKELELIKKERDEQDAAAAELDKAQNEPSIGEG